MELQPIEKRYEAKLKQYGLKAGSLQNPVQILYAPGEVLFREGDAMDYFLVVVKGKAKVCRETENGGSLILCFYLSDGVIGDAELVNDRQTASTTMVALSDFLCLGIPFAENRRALRGNLTFMNAICRELSDKLLDTSDKLMENVLYSAKERFAAYIRENSCNSIFAENLSNAAKSLGISYRHAMRLLKEFCSEGFLTRKRNGYYVNY